MAAITKEIAEKTYHGRSTDKPSHGHTRDRGQTKQRSHNRQRTNQETVTQQTADKPSHGHTTDSGQNMAWPFNKRQEDKPSHGRSYNGTQAKHQAVTTSSKTASASCAKRPGPPQPETARGTRSNK